MHVTDSGVNVFVFINELPDVLSTGHRFISKIGSLYTQLQKQKTVLGCIEKHTDNQGHVFTEIRPAPGEIASGEITYINNFQAWSLKVAQCLSHLRGSGT